MNKPTTLTLATLLIATAVYTSKNPLSKPIHAVEEKSAPSIDISSLLERSTAEEASVLEKTSLTERVPSNVTFSSLSEGGRAEIVINDRTFLGKINTVHTDVDGVVRVGGEVPRGSFCFAIDDSGVNGVVMYPTLGFFFQTAHNESGEIEWIQKPLSKLACFEFPGVAEGAPTTAPSNVVTTQQNVPVLNSRPSAPITLFLDFVGGTIKDPLWNKGQTINATPANFTADQIKTAFDVVVERFSPFNVNITTDPAKYTATAPGKRMRVVITTNCFIPGYGGYAFIGSLALAGQPFYTTTVPCFVFVNNLSNNPKYVGEAAAHELGHTFGLRHDGILGSSSYYTGQGNWAAIMGAAYYKPVVQWSKGEYAKADNSGQDDLSVISSTAKAGYFTATNATSPTKYALGSFVTDVISNSNTVRYFDVNVSRAGVLQVNVNVTQYSGLNSVLEVRKDKLTLAKSNPFVNMNSTASCFVTPGTYTVAVYGEGEGDPKTNGYSSYGSVGTFVVSGTLK